MKQRVTASACGRLIQQFNQLLKQETFIKGAGIALSVLVGFLSAAAKLDIGGSIFAPFGIAFAAAAMSNVTVTRSHGYAPAAGAAIGYVLTAGTLSNMKYIAALVLMLSIRAFFSISPALKNSLVMPCAVSGASIFLTGALFTSMFGFNVYDILMVLCEAFLAGGITFFFIRAIALPAHKLAEHRTASHITAITDSQSRSCLIISCAVLLIGLTSLNIATLSLGRVLGAVIIMLCAFANRESGGAIAGIAAGLACAAGTVAETADRAAEFALICVGFSLGGLISGVFFTFGKLGVAISFVCVTAVSTALFAPETLSPLIEVCIAAVIFLMIPPTVAKRLTVSPADTLIRHSRAVKELSVSRLELAAASLKDVAATTRDVTEQMKKLFAKDDISTVFSNVADRFCRGCYKNVRCWQADYNSTMDVFNNLSTKLKEDGRLPEKCLPEHFARSCIAPDRLINEINLEYGEFTAKKHADGRIAQVRSIVTEQFDAIAALLSSLAKELSLIREAEPDSEQLLREAADKLLLSPLACSCFKDSCGRFTAELEIPEYKLPRIDIAEFTATLCDILGYDLALPSLKTLDGSAHLTFRERENYSLTFSHSQYSVSGKLFCGDAVSSFNDASARTYLIISDGMGSGKNASLDSSMAVGLLKRMITAGFDTNSALDMLNSAMLVKYGDESLATVDLACIDLFRGSVTFFKAGSAPSYIRRGNKVMRIDGASMPAGILGGISFDQSTFALKGGDLILMVSDGALPDGNTDWIASELEIRDGETLDDAANRILSVAKMRTMPGHEDDISVLLAQISK
ncbi:MAG: SpoIIE family protein phosphatase [Oscillospiraceae bacterium]|nr:SpoIIE family protein phosphatase [Oscillospiraceae bacterium]